MCVCVCVWGGGGGGGGSACKEGKHVAMYFILHALVAITSFTV